MSEPPPDSIPDTTSHAIMWQKELFGVAASSYLSDIAILSDTLAYAVGTVWLEDIPGHLDPLSYDFLRWNGRTWKAQHAAVGGQLRAVYAFAEDDIWVGGGGPFHWNGQSWTSYPIAGWWTPGYAARFWGPSSSDLYMAGENGCIGHFDGHTWTKVETGTTMTVKDIYGAKDPTTGSWEIVAIASLQYEIFDRIILKITGLNAVPIADSPLTEPLTACWFAPGGPYYVAGSGIFKKEHLADSLWMY